MKTIIVIIIARIYKTSDAQCSCSPPTDQCPARATSSRSGPPTPDNFSQFFKFFHMMSYGMEHPFGQFRSGVLVLSPPSSLHPPPSPVSVRSVQEAETSSALYSTPQQHLNHWCVVNIVFLSKPKQSIIPTTMKKINSVPAETRTDTIQGYVSYLTQL